jgi:hypothetical protein
MAYELTGKIKLLQDLQTFDSGFKKREMVVTVEDGKYEQDINLEFLGDKVALLDDVQAGQEVTVSFDIRGREYNGRYYNNLTGWKITGAGQAAEMGDMDAPPASYSEPAASGGNFDDDIPF